MVNKISTVFETTELISMTKFSNLIEDIYDAALEPARWNNVVVGINEFVGGKACGIFSKDLISKSGVTHYFCGADPHYIKLYAETYSKLGPLTSYPPLGKIVSMPDLVPYDEFYRGRFYQEWMRPQGCLDMADVVLENSKSEAKILLAVHIGKRMVDDDMRRRIALLVPHAQRALTINRAIDRKKSETATFADALDGLGAGIFFVDAECRVIHANAAGESMLCEDDYLRLIGDRLALRDGRANQNLRQTVASGRVAVAADRNALALTAHDGARYVVHLLPLNTLVRNGARAPFNAVAAVFVRKAEMDGQSYGGLIARAFGLTPAELRVLLSIVEVGGVPESSEKLGIAETTVKTHLKQVFSKTGASRQADLVKLAAGFSFPLAKK
jgi:DNA-binding CsgD family transcriptional regulator/PAS domain-containing protein